jgi:hypothetical protein
MASQQPAFSRIDSTIDPNMLNDLDLLRYYFSVNSGQPPIKVGDPNDSVIVSISLEMGDDCPIYHRYRQVAVIGLSYLTHNDTVDYLCNNDNRRKLHKEDIKTLIRKITAKHAQVPEAQCFSDLLTFGYGPVERLTQEEAIQYTAKALLELTDGGRKDLIILSNNTMALDFSWWNDQEDTVPPPHPYMAATGLSNYRVLDVDQLAKEVGSSSNDLCVRGHNDMYENGHTPSNAGNEATWNLLLAIVIANFSDYGRTSRTIMGQTISKLAQYLENEKTRERLDRLEHVLRVGGQRQRSADALAPY